MDIDFKKLREDYHKRMTEHHLRRIEKKKPSFT